MGTQQVVLSSKEDAKRVLEGMKDIIIKYKNVSWSDFYELVGLPSTYINTKRGWTDLTGVKVLQVSKGFVLGLPPEEEI